MLIVIKKLRKEDTMKSQFICKLMGSIYFLRKAEEVLTHSMCKTRLRYFKSLLWMIILSELGKADYM